MFSNYIKIAFRNLIRHKLYSLINITGLAIGMACTIIIMLWVQDELSYDKFHKNADNIYRVIGYQTYSNQGSYIKTTPHPLAEALKNDFPEVISATRYDWKISLKNLVYKNKRIQQINGAVADPSFLKMFSFPFTEGNYNTALSEPFSIVLSQDTAYKVFGMENALGKIMRVENRFDLKVTGVFNNIPANSHMQFDYVISFETLAGMSDKPDSYSDWGNYTLITYILLRDNANSRALEQKIKGYLKSRSERSETDLYLQPLTDIHLHSGAMDKGSSSIFNVYLFSAISVFILLISCINYICLTTARYSLRAKEVGIRKASGAKQLQLVFQFLCESVIITLIALIFSLCIVELFLPAFNNLSGKELVMECTGNLNFSGMVLLVTLITGLLSGFYPALILSNFKPCDVLKGDTGSNRKDRIFRKGMVCLQWIITIILIIGTWVALKQFTYLQNKNLGFDRDQIVYLEMDEDLKQKYELIKTEFLNNPNVVSVTSCRNLPDNFMWSTSNVDWEGKDNDDSFNFSFNSIDFDFIETFSLKILEGRVYSRTSSTGPSGDSKPAFIINETAVKKMGISDPIGKWMFALGQRGTIIGVLKDFNFIPLQYSIKPMIFCIAPRWNNNLVVRVSPDKMPDTVNSLVKKLKEFLPDNVYEFRYFKEVFNRRYRSEKMISDIMAYFAFLGIFIAALGLVALSGFTSEQRRKEIGIRKSLGASAMGIILLMSKNYVKLVAVTNIIAWPIAWYFLNDWLNKYAYRINIGWIPFVGTGVIVMVISQVIVSYHCIKAAITDPIKTLRYE